MSVVVVAAVVAAEAPRCGTDGQRSPGQGYERTDALKQFRIISLKSGSTKHIKYLKSQ